MLGVISRQTSFVGDMNFAVIANVRNSEVSAKREFTVNGSAPTLYKYLDCCFRVQTRDEAKKNAGKQKSCSFRC